MPKSLGLVCNFFNEVDSLPGWLEVAARFYDDIQTIQAGPRGEESDDGSVEILEKWRIPIHRTSIDQGFGIVRTAAVRASKCDYVVLLDCDERLYPFAQVMSCSGESTPPEQVSRILQEYDDRQLAVPSNWENLSKLGANLTVSYGEVYNQGAWLKDMIQHGDLDCVQAIRRHWHDFTFRRPTQNWHELPDFQYRIVRNHPSVHWDANTRMHEGLIGADNRREANQVHGPFIDHFHLFFKRLAPEKRKFAIAVYDSIHRGEAAPSWAEFKKGR